MQIVIDTNVIISGIFFNGKSRELLKKFFENKVDIVCTEEIITEYAKTIEKPTKKYEENIGKEIVSILLENLKIIENVDSGRYSRDPDDDRFINCAKSADVNYIISGDNDLFSLKEVEGIRIITVSDFFKENRL